MAFRLFKQPRAQLVRRFVVPLVMGIAISIAMIYFAVRQLDQWQLFWTLEAAAYDIRLRASATHQPDERIVIVDIDEKSLDAEGHWPWPRDRLATLVNRLTDAGATVSAFDVVFAEADSGKDRELLDRLLETPFGQSPSFVALSRELREDLDRDKQFAGAVARGRVVMGYFFSLSPGTNPKGALPDNSIPYQELRERGVVVQPVAESYGANLPELQQAAVSGGFFSTVPDPDGVLRRVPLFTVYDDRLYPSLALETARLYLGNARPTIVLDNLGQNRTAIDSVLLGEREIATDAFGHVLVPYRGPGKTFSYLSATDVLNNAVPRDALADKIVLIGTSAMGLLDLRATPVDPAYPGVEVHANIISAILDGDLRSESLEKLGIDATTVAVFGLLLSGTLPLVSPIIALLLTLGAIALIVVINLLAWQAGLVLALAAPILTILFVFGANMAYGFLFESRSRRQLKSMFGQYVPPELVDEMSDDPEHFNMEGESRLMTVLFADIRSFTTISESMTPRELKDMLNRYFTPMTRIIYEHRGTMDKYVGDMIMAFWGAPLQDPDHARNGVLAAMAMVRETEDMQLEFATMGYPEISIGVGLNTGPMNVGNMGSEYRMAYTVLGDAVNLGSRLEGLTKQYGAKILVSEDTARGIDDVIFREIDRVVVKGQTRPIKILEPLCMTSDLTSELKQELELASRAMKLYRAREWDNAEMQFISLAQKHPGNLLYQLYIKERIPFFRANPPPQGWRGEFQHTSK